MDIEKGQTDVEQNQLLEIYKLHTQLASSASIWRTATNRFYQLTLSGILLFFITVVQHKDKILSDELSDKLTTEILIIGLGYIGLFLSWIWFVSIDTHLDSISRKYEVLKELEAKLEFQFITHEWELLGKNRKNSTYRKLAFREVLMPYFFYGSFFLLFLISSLNMPNITFSLLIIPVIMLINISFRLKG